MAETGITLRELDARPVVDLNGVGPARQKALGAVGIASILDLLGFYPRRYLDRSREATVAELDSGSEGMVLVRIDRVSARRTRNGRSLVEVRCGDDTGRLRLTFFNQPWREKQLREGMQAVVFGKADEYRGTLQMTSPVVDLVGDRTGRIVAVYPQSETAGLHSWDVDALVGEALRRTMKVRGLSDPVPVEVVAYELDQVQIGIPGDGGYADQPFDHLSLVHACSLNRLEKRRSSGLSTQESRPTAINMPTNSLSCLDRAWSNGHRRPCCSTARCTPTPGCCSMRSRTWR